MPRLPIAPETNMLRVLLNFNVKGQDKPLDTAMFVAKVIIEFPTAEVWLTRHECHAYVMVPTDVPLPALQAKAKALEAEYHAAFQADRPYRPFEEATVIANGVTFFVRGDITGIDPDRVAEVFKANVEKLRAQRGRSGLPL